MLAKEVYDVQGLSMGVNYGADKVRFPAPVPVGSRVRATATLTAVKDIPVGTQASITFVVEREGGDKPVCVADVLYVMAG